MVRTRLVPGLAAGAATYNPVSELMLAAEAKRQALLVYGMRALGDNFL